MQTLQVNQSDEFKNQVRKLLHESENLRIVFTKKDGTEREMFCTLSESKIPAEKQPKSQASDSETAGNGDGSAIRVFDTSKQEWRSFRWDSVIEVK